MRRSALTIVISLGSAPIFFTETLPKRGRKHRASLRTSCPCSRKSNLASRTPRRRTSLSHSGRLSNENVSGGTRFPGTLSRISAKRRVSPSRNSPQCGTVKLLHRDLEDSQDLNCTRKVETHACRLPLRIDTDAFHDLHWNHKGRRATG